MRKKILGFLAVLLLTGCNNNSVVNSSIFNSDSSETFPTISVDSDFNYSYDLSYNISSCLTNIINDIPIAVGNEYSLSFNFSMADSSKAVITSSNENVFVIQYKDNGSTILKCLSAGDSILTIKDEEDIIHFRYVVHVRNKLTKEAADEYLVNVDYWENVAPYWSGGYYDMIFIGQGICYFNVYVNGVIAEQYTLNYEYTKTLDEFIVYTITAMDPTNSQLRLREMYLEITGYEIAVYDVIGHNSDGSEALGVLDIFRPRTNVE